MTSAPLRRGSVSLGMAGIVLILGAAAPEKPSVLGESPVAVGEYLVAIGGCNDCHTDGWNRNPGGIPVAHRLTGSAIGWNGPWGTSFPTNLRLLLQTMIADDWVKYVAAMQPRPPMPWFNMRSMSEADQRAIYAYIRSLGPAGVPAPEALPPGKTPNGPYIVAVPRPPG